MSNKQEFAVAASAVKPNSSPALANVDELTVLCKALADSLRLEILRVLRIESFAVLEINSILETRQSALSHHLKILANAGLVSTRKEGNSIFYRRSLLSVDDPFYSFKKNAVETVDRIPVGHQIRARIKVIQRDRAHRSLDYFEKNADKFREKQGLITHRSQYAGSLQDVLSGIARVDEIKIMEVGPGEGELLSELARVYSEVVALDNSKEMLGKAEATIAHQKLHNVTFLHGDTQTALKKKILCDLLIFDMVLHHISSPAATFQDAEKLLTPGGDLLIVDLCSHDQDWVRESCGDLWLGFESEELTQWAEQAGLSDGQSLYLGLRNGFQIQMRVFSKNTNTIYPDVRNYK